MQTFIDARAWGSVSGRRNIRETAGTVFSSGVPGTLADIVFQKAIFYGAPASLGLLVAISYRPFNPEVRLAIAVAAMALCRPPGQGG